MATRMKQRAFFAGALALWTVGCTLPATTPNPNHTINNAAVNLSDPKTGVDTGVSPSDDPTGLTTGNAAPLSSPPPPLSTAETTVGLETGQDLVTALDQEQDLDIYGLSFDQGTGNPGASGYRLFDTAATGTATPTASATGVATPVPVVDVSTLDEGASAAALPVAYRPSLVSLTSVDTLSRLIGRIQVLATHLVTHENRMTELTKLDKQVALASWRPNSDKTISKTVVTLASRPSGTTTVTRHVVQTLTVEPATSLMVQHTAQIDTTFPGGASRRLNRELVLLADGVQEIVLTQTTTGPAGGKRVVNWTNKIDLDGVLTGTGTYKVYAPNTRLVRSWALTVDGSADLPHVRAEDGAHGLLNNLSIASDTSILDILRDGVGSNGSLTVTPDVVPSDTQDAADVGS